MTAVEQAKRVYDLEPCRRSFREDLELHLLGGYVFSGPDFFIMGRPVVRDSDEALIVNPAHRFPERLCDTWMIYLAAGPGAYQQFVRVEPYPLPWFAWERKNALRFYSRDAILSRVAQTTPSILAGHAPVQGG